ncbi:hypothetical protein ACXYX3_01295 [Mycobacterium sp. C3-094]|uniref:hypothetical protein n=1 Tax=Mycobacterium sp. PSTR-4-N TaxID=2917745 RepID=UPI001F15263E|nr:hypothetical protein [Mycobacterium sp. PSTR-4-N]MCG7596944.1 hypothetical protein [Mycobacterium sp. PSTR-4-N]
MAIGDYDVLARASRTLRAAPERGWPAVERRVIEAVRATPRSGWPVAVVDPRPGQAAGRIEVSDLVVRANLARVLRTLPEVKLVDITVSVEDAVLREVRIEVSGRYGADLAAAAEGVRRQAVAVITDVIGDAAGVAIDVAITDVHR